MQATTADITPAPVATVANATFPTADTPLPTAAAIDFFPIASTAAVSHAKEPTAANILQCDSDEDGKVNTAADAHP